MMGRITEKASEHKVGLMQRCVTTSSRPGALQGRSAAGQERWDQVLLGDRSWLLRTVLSRKAKIKRCILGVFSVLSTGHPRDSRPQDSVLRF